MKIFRKKNAHFVGSINSFCYFCTEINYLTQKLKYEKNVFRQVFEASSAGASSIQSGDVQPDHDLNVFLFLVL